MKNLNKRCFQIIGHHHVELLYFEEDKIYTIGKDRYISMEEDYDIGIYLDTDIDIYKAWSSFLVGNPIECVPSLTFIEVPLEGLLTHSSKKIRDWAKGILR